MKIKPVFRYDPSHRTLRLARLIWQRGVYGAGYSAKLSIALRPRMFFFARESDGWIVTVLGVRLHHQRSYGGIFV